MTLREQLDGAVQERGQDLIDSLSTSGFKQLFSPDRQLLNWVIKRPQIKSSLFRLVDVLPALDAPEDVIDHLRAYLSISEGADSLPRWIRWGLESSDLRMVPDGVVARTAKWSVKQLADRFIAGSTPAELKAEVKQLEGEGFAVSIDRLGEEVIAESEAEAYQKAYLSILKDLDGLEESVTARARGRSLSVKLTALDSQFDPVARNATLDRLEERVMPILREAKDRDIIVYFDMEQDDSREITLELARRLLRKDLFEDWNDLGLVIQAYHKNSYSDCQNLLEWCQEHDRRIWIRLVKGAYWDSERIRAYRNNWEVPVYEAKGRTDWNYERLARLLGEYHPVARPAFGSHNLRSLAYGSTVADYFDLPRRDWELQMLYGMGEPIQRLMKDRDRPVRLYVPYGELVPGMAYLVCRLLENTSNQSFLRQTFHESGSTEDPMAAPDKEEVPASAPRREGYQSVGPQNFNRADEVSDQDTALRRVYRKLGMDYPLRVDGEWTSGDGWVRSYNPSRSDELVGRIGRVGETELEQALSTSDRVFPD
ncbi:MAG: proline dehydrogenase family protein, partial [bacterium]